MTPLEIVRQTSPIVNQAGNRFYFDGATMERGKELGLSLIHISEPTRLC